MIIKLAQHVADRYRVPAADVVDLAAFAVAREREIRLDDVAHVEKVARGRKVADEELRRTAARRCARAARRATRPRNVLAARGRCG